MLEQTLKKISNLGYDICWRYEPMTDSIIIRVRKDNFIMDQKIGLDINMYGGGSAGFEFWMNRYLVMILDRLEEMEKKDNEPTT